MTFFNKIKNLFAGKAKSQESTKASAKAVRKPATGKKTVAKKTAAKKQKTLDFFKFVSTDKTRLFMNGVYHEGEAKIATDGRILAMAKSEYEERFENVILSKNLTPIDGDFPNWKKVIPDFSKMQKAAFDYEQAKASLKKAKPILRIYKKLTSQKIFYRLDCGIFISVDYLEKILHFAECYQSDLYIQEGNRPCALVCGNAENPDAMCVFMPCIVNQWDFESDNFIFTGDFSELSVDGLLARCGKRDILQRKEYGTMTEKDIAFLEDVHDFMAIFQKKNVA